MAWCTSPVLAIISVTVSVFWQALARSGQCWQVWQVPKPWLLGDEAILACSDSRDLASSGTFWQVLASSGHESILPCCTDFCHVQQTRLPTPKTASSTRGFAQGGAPTPQRAGRQIKVAAARRGSMRVDLGLRKLFTSRKPERSSPAVHPHAKRELRQSVIVSFGRIFKSMAYILSIGSRAHQGSGPPPNARFVTGGNTRVR